MKTYLIYHFLMNTGWGQSKVVCYEDVPFRIAIAFKS